MLSSRLYSNIKQHSFALRNTSNAVLNRTVRVGNSQSFSKPKKPIISIQQRYYARWGRVVSKMSPATLAKMRAQAMQSNRAQPTGTTVSSSNIVGDPWLRPRFSNPFAAKFWSDMVNWGKHLFMGYIGSPMRVKEVSKSLKIEPFTRRDVRAAAEATYIKFNQCLSRFDLDEMKSFVSDNVMRDLKAKYGRAVLPAKGKPSWEARNLKITLLNYVIVQVPEPINMHIVQATVRITGQQQYVVKDKNGNVLLGKEDFTPVEDIWVVEKIIEKPANPWHVVATHLEHPDDVVEQAKTGTK